MQQAYVVLVVFGLWLTTAVQAADRDVFLDGHNRYRRTEAKTEDATNIGILEWNRTLARQAQDWADACEYHHDDVRNQGQNLYYAAPIRASHDDAYYINRAMAKWMQEKDFNDGSFDCCYHGSYTCCHYTAMVSARVQTVGCAIAHCDNLVKSSGTTHNAAYVVCNYYPEGNMAINGNHNYYRTGRLCSECDNCDDGLCV